MLFAAGISRPRQRSSSANTNIANTDRQHQQNSREIVAIRKTIDGYEYRCYKTNTDVFVHRTSFATDADYMRVMPGYGLMVTNAGCRRNVVVSTKRVAPSVFEGYGRVSSVTAANVIFIEDNRRLNAPRSAFSFHNDSNPTIHLDHHYHFAALPPITDNGKQHDNKKKQSTMPLVFAAHRQTDACSKKLRHHPAHWNDIAQSPKPHTHN